MHTIQYTADAHLLPYYHIRSDFYECLCVPVGRRCERNWSRFTCTSFMSIQSVGVKLIGFVWRCWVRFCRAKVALSTFNILLLTANDDVLVELSEPSKIIIIAAASVMESVKSTFQVKIELFSSGRLQKWAKCRSHFIYVWLEVRALHQNKRIHCQQFRH